MDDHDMINLSYSSVGEIRGLGMAQQASLAIGEYVVLQGVWPTGQPRLIMDGDWHADDLADAARSVTIRCDVGDSASGPWSLWASIHQPAMARSSETPWQNVPAPPAGRDYRVVVVSGGNTNRIGVTVRGGSAFGRSV